MASSRCSRAAVSARTTTPPPGPASDDLCRSSCIARVEGKGEDGAVFDLAAAAAATATTTAAAADSSDQQKQQHHQQSPSLDGSASEVEDDNDDDCDGSSVYSPASIESDRKHSTAPAAATEEAEAEAVVMDDDEMDDAFDEMGDASDDGRPKKTKPAPVSAFNFSFALGGWLMIYNFGVAKCLLDHGLHKVDPERQSIIGSSAGSLSAAALVLEADIDKVWTLLLSTMIRAELVLLYTGTSCSRWRRACKCDMVSTE